MCIAWVCTFCLTFIVAILIFLVLLFGFEDNYNILNILFTVMSVSYLVLVPLSVYTYKFYLNDMKYVVVCPIIFIICMLLLVNVFFIEAKFYAFVVLSVFLTIYVYLIVLDSSKTTYTICVSLLEDAINLAEISELVDDLKQEESETS